MPNARRFLRPFLSPEGKKIAIHCQIQAFCEVSAVVSFRQFGTRYPYIVLYIINTVIFFLAPTYLVSKLAKWNVIFLQITEMNLEHVSQQQKQMKYSR